MTWTTSANRPIAAAPDRVVPESVGRSPKPKSAMPMTAPGMATVSTPQSTPKHSDAYFTSKSLVRLTGTVSR